MEEVKFITKLRVENLTNAFDEKQTDWLQDNTYIFKKGKIYGIIGEYGEGGELLSLLLSGRIPLEDEILYYDEEKADSLKIQELGWYVGKPEYAKGIIKYEISVKKALTHAIKKYKRYNSLQQVIQDFFLTEGRLDYRLFNYSGERLRASLAIGYACKKEIYCFPWMNTSTFCSIILSSGVFRFFKRMKEEGMIMILPTARRENVIGLVDEIIEINNPAYKRMISESQYFKDNF